MKKALFFLGVALLVTAHSHAPRAQPYPVRAIRIVVPFAPGGNVDLVVRGITPRLSELLGQQVIADNRPGSSGLLGTHLVARSAADGYTLLAMANTFAVVPSIMPNPGYERSALFPELPTIDESGMRGFEDITFNGLVAPAGTPREVLQRLNAAVARAVAGPDPRQRFVQFGVELVASASPEAFMEYIRAEFVKKARLAREAGIRIE